MTDKPIESIIIPEADAEIWSEEEEGFVMNCPSNLYIINAMGDRVFFKTKDRAAAQNAADELYGKGRYIVRTVKDMKGKPRTEYGHTCTGTQTRRGQKR